ncbi:MAG: hypothetical protein UU08_C0031G0007 [Candidatus Uhrbacteria bacterium GW2011_GWE2_40_58]|nr:MAG: hypothetical protein UT94_C0031G0008 [Candidatus Uhrbacteria bacterium GW2011_GWF2_40_263]KKR66877.1 MAG: hypothetical protein UU08_C0031G0007 [Candidatus Uhrbacteria bacterium GW2011_GWE2_40_58]OGL93825.1 MAG: hypothetical protein A2239_03975 [Candidatus Uhrbacteria bacterium RIFOXYA2_FULL_40_9]OGL97983.1 MAG: hypothetical protein A2332_00585 [Candidatus Uhrbacteria bacterium RIFOXYB2_FULL_41_18]HBK35243.1 hypothetical protein [Candidatus Uhrbacteria bacterium]
MSFTYISLHQQTLGQDQNTIAEIIARLSQTNPARAQQFSRVDWISLRKALALKALELVQQKMGGTFSKQYRRPNDATREYRDPQGECLGVITKDNVQVGLFLHEGKVTLYWSEWHRDGHNKTPKKLSEEVQATYKDQCIQAALQLLTNQQVFRVEQEDGTVIYEAQIQEVK